MHLVSAPFSTSLPPDALDFARALTGQYELECEIGRGGMGIVYRARDLKLDRLVAIKTLPPHLAGDPLVRERFLREARTAARLSHPNIVPIHRADEMSGHVFFVMGLVDGESLAQRIRGRGRLDPREVARELRDVAAALQHAHERRVIHRDVKAENILIDRSTGHALVTDFGIARLAEATPLTSTGQILGTVYYLSPEQVSGDEVDARSDIYSLGVVGFLAATGRFPFDAELASAVLIAHVTKSAPPAHTVALDLPRPLADLIDRCLLKDPADRFQQCAEIIAAIDSMLPAIDAAPHRIDAEPPRPHALVSDTEAHAIFGRAADLQAKTGVVPRPAPIGMRRDAAADASRTSGFSPELIRDVAVEAGIPARYVDHALAERGLAPGVALESRPPVIVDRSPTKNRLTGASRRFEFEVIVEGEMPEADFDLVAEHIRVATGDPGQSAAVGRSFSWHGRPDRRDIHVSILSRDGRTIIHVSEGLGRLTGGLFGGIVGGGGGGTAGVWFGLAAALHAPLLGFPLWAGGIAVAYTTARTIFVSKSKGRAAEMYQLTETLAALARDSIAATRARLSGPAQPRIRG